jgi:hypothetical protein
VPWADADALDVAGPQGAAVVEHPALDDRRVADELAVLVGQGMDAAEPVLPVVVGELAPEGLVEQDAGGHERGVV